MRGISHRRNVNLRRRRDVNFKFVIFFKSLFYDFRNITNLFAFVKLFFAYERRKKSVHAHTGVFGPAVRTNASRLGREVRNGGYPVWAICRLQAVLFYIFNRFDDIKLLVRRQPTEIGEKPIPQRRHKSFKFFNLFQRRIG